MLIIDEKLLNQVSKQANDSPRLRMNYNFHNSLNELCHRMLNVQKTVDIHPPKTGISVHFF